MISVCLFLPMRSCDQTQFFRCDVRSKPTCDKIEEVASKTKPIFNVLRVLLPLLPSYKYFFIQVEPAPNCLQKWRETSILYYFMEQNKVRQMVGGGATHRHRRKVLLRAHASFPARSEYFGCRQVRIPITKTSIRDQAGIKQEVLNPQLM